MPFLGSGPQLHSESSLDFFDSLPQVGAAPRGQLLLGRLMQARAGAAGAAGAALQVPRARRARAPYSFAVVHCLLGSLPARLSTAAACAQPRMHVMLLPLPLLPSPNRLPSSTIRSLECTRLTAPCCSRPCWLRLSLPCHVAPNAAARHQTTLPLPSTFLLCILLLPPNPSLVY